MNKVTWFEIPFDDPRRFQKFYNDVFGWEFDKIPEQDYYRVNLITENINSKMSETNGIKGGFYKRESNIRHPMISIQVKSIDEYFKKIEKHGGKPIHPKKPIPEGGFYARFIDTEENIVEIWENNR